MTTDRTSECKCQKPDEKSILKERNEIINPKRPTECSSLNYLDFCTPKIAIFL